MAFDLKEPWNTHKKYQVFEDKYADLFGRKDVTADHVLMCQVIMESIERNIGKIRNTLFGKHVLARYFILYVVRLILESDELASELFSKPDSFVRNAHSRWRFGEAIGNIVADVVDDVNASVEDLGEDFDYRNRLREEPWVKQLASQIAVDHKKLVRRQKIKPFKEEWEAGLSQ
jgi:hypothetical protein